MKIKMEYLVALYFVGLNLVGIGMSIINGIASLLVANGLGILLLVAAIVVDGLLPKDDDKLDA
jgi:hypothetical protein